MNRYPLKTALSQAYELYGLELDEDRFETYAMSAWRKIGNKECKMNSVLLRPEKDPNGGWFICKPADLEAIEAITLCFEDAQETSAIYNHAGAYNFPVENWIETTKHNSDSQYISGKFVKFDEIGDRIYFTEPYEHVNLLYKALAVDDEGLPFINDKEAEAIAAYCAFVEDNRKARLTKDPNTFQMAQLEEARWKRLCDAARVPESISQNEMNNILDAAVSRDVHNYGRTYKPKR